MHWNSPPQQTFDVQPLELPLELLPELLPLLATQQDTPLTAGLQFPTGVVVQLPTSQGPTQLPSVPRHSLEAQVSWAGLHPDASSTPANGIRTPNTKM